MRKTALIVAGAVVVSATLGALGGFFYAKKVVTEEAEKHADEQIAEVKETYKRIYKSNKGDVSQVQSDALELTKAEARRRRDAEAEVNQLKFKVAVYENREKQLLDFIEKSGVNTEDLEIVTDPLDEYDTQSDDPDDVIYVENDSYDIQKKAQELQNSDADPYIIKEEDFNNDSNEGLYNQMSYSWYAGDNTLSDDTNTPFVNEDNYANIVGTNFRDHISEEEPIIYVRNEQRMEEYEISYKDQKYGDSLA